MMIMIMIMIIIIIIIIIILAYYRIAENFQGVQFLRFLRLIGKPRKLNPRNKVLACN